MRSSQDWATTTSSKKGTKPTGGSSGRLRASPQRIPHTGRHSIELARDVESHIPIRAVRTSSRDLCNRRPEGISEVQLEHVTADALLDGDAALSAPRPVARDTRSQLADDVDGRPDADARAEADHERVVVVDDFLRKRV